MADNQHVNKVVYGNTVLIDLTTDTVTADKILTSYTAHDATGNTVTGTCDFDVNSQDANVKVAEILSGKTAYARGTKLVGTMPNNGAVSLTISSIDDSVSIAQGYDLSIVDQTPFCFLYTADASEYAPERFKYTPDPTFTALAYNIRSDSGLTE